MRKCTIALLRIHGPSLHSHAFLSCTPPHPALSLSTLPSTPEARNVGARKPDASLDIAVETRNANVRKAGKLKLDKIDSGSLHAELPTSITEEKAKARPTSATKAKKRATANVTGTKATEISAHKAEGVIVHEVAQNAVTGKAEDPALHVKFLFEEEKAVQNVRAEATVVNATENESMIKAKKELSKLDLSIFKHGRQWEETVYKLLDFGISSAYVMKMLQKCRSVRFSPYPDSILNHFTALGMSHDQMGRAISTWPSFLKIPNDAFQSKVEFWESMGLDKHSLGRIMHLGYPNIGLPLSTLKGRSDFWKDYFQDVQENALRTLISANPRILTIVKPRIAYLVEELGFSKKVLLRRKRLLYGLLGRTTLKLHARLHNLVAMGFSFDQIQMMIARNPYLLVHKEDHINLRLSYAVNVMNVSLDTLAACSGFWGCSYEKRIKYRYEVLQELKALGAYKRNITPGYMIHMTEKFFYRRFVGILQAYTKHSNI